MSSSFADQSKIDNKKDNEKYFLYLYNVGRVSRYWCGTFGAVLNDQIFSAMKIYSKRENYL